MPLQEPFVYFQVFLIMASLPPRSELPDLRQLQAFCQIIDCSSMAEASRLQGVTQSAMSQSLSRLEKQLGVALIDRQCRPLKPTVAGDRLYRESQTLLSEARGVMASVSHATIDATRFLRCGFVDSFASVFAPVVVNRLGDKVEELTLRSGFCEPNEQNLLQRNIDVVVTSSALEHVHGLERYHLFSDPYLLVLPPDRQVSSLEEMVRLSQELGMIRYSRHSRMGLDIDIHLRRMGLESRRRVEFDTTDSLLALVQANLGWGITTALSLMHARHEAFRVRVVPLPGAVLQRGLYLLAWQGEQGSLPSELARFCQQHYQHVIKPEFDDMLHIR